MSVDWIIAYRSVHDDGITLQIEVGVDTTARDKKQYVIGADSGRRICISAGRNSNIHTIAIITDREWYQISHLIHYATQSSCDIDVGDILGKHPQDIATAISICGSLAYSLGRQAVCKILADFGPQALPESTKTVVNRYNNATANEKLKFCCDRRKRIRVVRWNQMTIHYTPVVHGDQTRKRWRLYLGHGREQSLTDHEILDLVDRVDAALDVTKVTKPK